MKTITKSFEVFSFDELNENAQEKIINDTIQFILETNYTTPDVEKAVNKADEMRTPWFVGAYIWDYAKEDVLSIINDFEYLSNGELFSE